MASKVGKVQRVAIVGAGGTVGTHIAEALLATGQHTITALTRASSTSKLPAGLQRATIDYDTPSTLERALAGQDVLIITLSVLAPPDTQSALIQAAARAGVRYVIPNAWGTDFAHGALVADLPGADAIPAALREIEAAGMAWVALVCGFWYEHSVVLGPEGFGFDFAAKTLTAFDGGATPVNVSTQAQCGRAVAALLSSPDLSAWANKPVYVSSWRLTQREMLASWERVTGETWAVEDEPSEKRFQEGLQRMYAGDRTGFVQAMYARTLFPNGDGDFEGRHGLANKALGLPVEELDEATRHAKEMLDGGWNYFTNRL